mgnify:CR=1 FL=1
MPTLAVKKLELFKNSPFQNVDASICLARKLHKKEAEQQGRIVLR